MQIVRNYIRIVESSVAVLDQHWELTDSFPSLVSVPSYSVLCPDHTNLVILEELQILSSIYTKSGNIGA